MLAPMSTGSRCKLARILISVAFSTSSATAAELALPLGWRAPASTELTDAWRDNSPDRYVAVQGDFDGNGLPDQARLLVSLSGQRLGLFIFLQQSDLSYRRRLAFASRGEPAVEAFGIRKVRPGAYRTACGKGYWECRDAEPDQVVIRHDAVEFFKFESLSSYHFWDHRLKVFKAVQIAD
jgi:hypothetical protein